MTGHRARPASVEAQPAGAASARARRFVADRHPAAVALGRRLADRIADPTAFVTTLDSGLARLADPVYRDAQAWIAPGASGVVGVRSPLLSAVQRPIAQALRAASPAISIYLADACSRHVAFEIRLFALVPLRRSLADDPERTWQIVRRLARRASDWVSVDALADVVARGVLLEPFRWAEIELLVYSPHRWERRLVGSTLAQLPFRLPRARRASLRERPGLTIIESLIGDAEPDVQKALAWALRSWREVDAPGVTALLREQTELAARTKDGNRAWVVRDALTGARADPRLAAELRPRLAGLRRRAGAADTSRAGAAATAFHVPGGPGAVGPDAVERAEPPLDLPQPVTA